MIQKQDDPPIEEIRDIRRRISATFGHDAHRLVAHYVELQKKYANRLAVPAKATRETDESKS